MRYKNLKSVTARKSWNFSWVIVNFFLSVAEVQQLATKEQLERNPWKKLFKSIYVKVFFLAKVFSQKKKCKIISFFFVYIFFLVIKSFEVIWAPVAP